jgi:hypothetical protein
LAQPIVADYPSTNSGKLDNVQRLSLAGASDSSALHLRRRAKHRLD